MLLARYTKWNRTCVAFWLRFGFQGTKVGNDAIDMEGNEGLSAFFAEEEGAVGGLVVEEVLGRTLPGGWPFGEWAFGAVEFFC